MEKASDGSFTRTTRKTAEDDDEDEKDWDRTLNTYKASRLTSRRRVKLVAMVHRVEPDQSPARSRRPPAG
jgi:hypothetical protein